MATRFPADLQVIEAIANDVATNAATTATANTVAGVVASSGHFVVTDTILGVAGGSSGDNTASPMDTSTFVSPNVFNIKELLVTFNSVPTPAAGDTEIIDVRIYEDSSLTETRMEFLNIDLSAGQALIPVHQVFLNKDTPTATEFVYVEIANKNPSGTRDYFVELRCNT